MNFDLSVFINLIKMLLLYIFETYEVDKEFEAIGFDIVSLLKGTTATEEG